jgi:predicted amidohydrolase
MRIGCLQFAPRVGDVDNNLSRADKILSSVNPEDLDILVLPELAFTGMSWILSSQFAPPSIEIEGRIHSAPKTFLLS